MPLNDDAKCPPSPRLGWLEAFLSSADRLDYNAAAIDLRISSSTVQRRVHKLELWLRKLLIVDDGSPLELFEVDGQAFVPVACDILNLFTSKISDEKSIHARRHISNISLDDFENFLAVAEEGSYKGASFATHCDTTVSWRSVQDLEKSLGKTLVLGHSRLRLSDEGAEFSAVARQIVRSFYNFQAELPADFDPERAALKDLFNFNNLLRGRLSAIAALIESSGKKQRGRNRLVDVKSNLSNSNILHSHLLESYGPFKEVPGKDIETP